MWFTRSFLILPYCSASGGATLNFFLALWKDAVKYRLQTAKIFFWIWTFLSCEKCSMLWRHRGIDIIKHIERFWLSESVRNRSTGSFCKIIMSQGVAWDKVGAGFSHMSMQPVEQWSWHELVLSAGLGLTLCVLTAKGKCKVNFQGAFCSQAWLWHWSSTEPSCLALQTRGDTLKSHCYSVCSGSTC